MESWRCTKTVFLARPGEYLLSSFLCGLCVFVVNFWCQVILIVTASQNYNAREHYAGKTKMRKKTLGRYIVADPEICHGQPTVRGTRVRVAQVLQQVAKGMDWDKIIWQRRGTGQQPPIHEHLQLDGATLQKKH